MKSRSQMSSMIIKHQLVILRVKILFFKILNLEASKAVVQLHCLLGRSLCCKTAECSYVEKLSAKVS